MNRSKLLILSGLALGAVAVPAALAQQTEITVPNRGAVHTHYRTATSGGGTTTTAGNGRRDGRYRSHWNGGYYGGGYYGGGFGYGDPFGYPYGYGFGYPSYGYRPYGYGYYASPRVVLSVGSNGYGARNGSVVVEVQRRLARAGYYHGAVDGVMGSGTRRAIRAYERSHGLRIDGEIDARLLGSLGLA